MPEAPNWLFVVNVGGWVITTLLGLVITLMKMENSRQERRLIRLEQDCRDINNRLLSDYLNKTDTREMVNQVRSDIAVINAKLDAVLMEGRKGQ